MAKEQAEVIVIVTPMARPMDVGRQLVAMSMVHAVVIELEAGGEVTVLVRETDVVNTSGSTHLLLAGVIRGGLAGQETDIGDTQQTEGLVVGTTGEDFKLISVLS